MIGNNYHRTSWYKCHVCGEPGQPYNILLQLQVWDQIYCHKHRNDGTPRCDSCGRLKIREVKYINYGDGRKLCPDCYFTAITDMNKLKSLIPKVKDFLDRELELRVTINFPILLVDREEMDESSLHRPRGATGRTFFHVQDINYVETCLKRGETMEIVKKTKRLKNHKVTGILLLFGLPKVHMGATLAHELMHAWMKQQGCYNNLDSKISEGICEVIAYKWLEWYDINADSTYGEKAQFVSNLKDYGKRCKELNTSDVYGKGFRDAKAAVQKYGLKYTLKHVAKYKVPPNVKLSHLRN